jgi:hypothetical protein
MKRLLIFSTALAVLALAGPARGQPTLYVVPDVPTDPDGPFFFPWTVVRHDHLSAVPYTLELTLPGNPTIDAMHKQDAPGAWLFAVEAPSDLGGSLPVPAEPRDVIRLDGGGTFALYFDGSCVAAPVPLGSGIDAMYQDGGDAGSLVFSFDVPTDILGVTYMPSELVRFKPIGLPPCGWDVSGSVIDFATIGGYFPGSTNVTGADFAAGRWILAFDIPVDLAPPVGPTRTPGQLVATNGLVWNHFLDDLQAEGTPGWPISSVVDALACSANPGRIDSPTVQILLDKSLPTIEILCPGGCSSGAEAWGLYEGTIANVHDGIYDHVAVPGKCQESCPGSIFHVPPALTSTYYIVVPHSCGEEGSYGRNSSGVERPQAAAPADRCVVAQNLSPCP